MFSVYFSPRYNFKCDRYEGCFNNIGNRILVGGDFNAKHTWWGSRLTNLKANELFKCKNIQNKYNSLSTGAPTYWPADIFKIPDVLEFFIYKGVPQTSLDSPIIASFTTACKKRQLNTNLFLAKTKINLFQRHIESQLDLPSSFNTEGEIDYAVEMFPKVIHEARLGLHHKI